MSSEFNWLIDRNVKACTHIPAFSIINVPKDQKITQLNVMGRNLDQKFYVKYTRYSYLYAHIKWGWRGRRVDHAYDTIRMNCQLNDLSS